MSPSYRTELSATGEQARVRSTPLLASAGVRYVVVPIALGVLVWLGQGEVMSGPRRLIALSALLLVYTGSEILCERSRRPTVWFLSLPTLTSVVSFVLPFSLTNVVFWTPARAYYFRKGVSFALLNKVVALAILALLCLWIGYRLALGRRIGRWGRAWMARWGVTKVSFRPAYLVIAIIVVLTTVVRYLMVRNGMYGIMRVVNPPAQVAKYLDWMRGLGQVCLLVVSIDYFSKRGPKSGKGLVLVLILLNELLWTTLSGFKARAVLPLVIVGFGYAIARGRIPWWAVVAFVVALVVSHSIVGSFRKAIGDNAFNPRSVSSAVTMLSKIALGESRYGEGRRDRGTRVSQWTRIADRTNQTGMGAIAVWFEDKKDARPEVEASGPRMQTILTSPIRAVIPRFLWPDKPTMTTVGEWFRLHAVGGITEGNTAIGMSIIGYLYVAGGIGAIAVCFLFLGLVERAIFDTFFAMGGGGLLVYVGLMSVLVRLPTPFDIVIINLIRLVPILLLVQFFVLKKE